MTECTRPFDALLEADVEELSGVAESVGSHPLELGTGLTTEQMRDENTLRDAGWDFGHVWTTCKGDYPRLQWETEDCTDQEQ